MAIATKCQTNGAVYETDCYEKYVKCKVILPFSLNLTEEEAELLEVNLHNAIELVLAPYFRNQDR